MDSGDGKFTSSLPTFSLLTRRVERNRFEMMTSRILSVRWHTQVHLRCNSCSLIHRVSSGVQAKGSLCRSRLRHCILKARVIFLLRVEHSAPAKYFPPRISCLVYDIAVVKSFFIVLELAQASMQLIGTRKPLHAAAESPITEPVVAQIL